MVQVFVSIAKFREEFAKIVKQMFCYVIASLSMFLNLKLFSLNAVKKGSYKMNIHTTGMERFSGGFLTASLRMLTH